VEEQGSYGGRASQLRALQLHCHGAAANGEGERCKDEVSWEDICRWLCFLVWWWLSLRLAAVESGILLESKTEKQIIRVIIIDGARLLCTSGTVFCAAKPAEMSASGHYESIKSYPRKPPFTTNPEKSHIYVSDTPARNGTAAPYVFGNSQEFERHIAATPRPSTRVVYVTLQSGAESVAY
jgi:hypothetical protein